MGGNTFVECIWTAGSWSTLTCTNILITVPWCSRAEVQLTHIIDTNFFLSWSFSKVNSRVKYCPTYRQEILIYRSVVYTHQILEGHEIKPWWQTAIKHNIIYITAVILPAQLFNLETVWWKGRLFIWVVLCFRRKKELESLQHELFKFKNLCMNMILFLFPLTLEWICMYSVFFITTCKTCISLHLALNKTCTAVFPGLI